MRSPPICLSYLFCGSLLFFGSSSAVAFQVNTGVPYFLYHDEDIYEMMVVLSAPFNPSPMYSLLPLAILYLTHHPAVTKVTLSVKYKHTPNRWQGKKSLSMDSGLVVKRKCTTLRILKYHNIIVSFVFRLLKPL